MDKFRPKDLKVVAEDVFKLVAVDFQRSSISI
jgi:hypothetical protein